MILTSDDLAGCRHVAGNRGASSSSRRHRGSQLAPAEVAAKPSRKVLGEDSVRIEIVWHFVSDFRNNCCVGRPTCSHTPSSLYHLSRGLYCTLLHIRTSSVRERVLVSLSIMQNMNS